MSNNNEILKHEGGDVGNLQMVSAKEAAQWYKRFVSFAKGILKPNLDYGVIPGTNKKNTLYKAGAEKLRFAFGLSSTQEMVDKTINFNPDYIDYTYRCTILTKSGQILAQCEGSCNSHEPNYRYEWFERIPAPEAEEAKLLKAQKVGKWTSYDNNGQKEWHWFDRMDNTQVFAKKNTIQKIAQKRAFVGAILVATGASEFFTQDLENMEGEDNGEPHTGDKGKAGKEKKQPDEEIVDPIWIETVNQCKKKEDLNNLYNQNKDVIIASPALKNLFKQRENELKKATTKEKVNNAVNDLEGKLKKS